MAVDRAVATTVVDTFAPRCPVLVGPPGGVHEGAAVAAGIRRWSPKDSATAATTPTASSSSAVTAGDLVDDPAAVAGRARSLAVGGGIHAVDGTWVALRVRTLCIHGDRDGADAPGPGRA